MKKLLPFLMAVAIVFAGCKKDDPDPSDTTPTTPSSSVFTFYKAGASWIYDVYDTDHNDTLQNTYTINSINAQNYATVTYNWAGFFSITQEWYADNQKFSMLCSQGGGTMLTFCDANPVVGETWFESWTDSTGTTTDTCRIEALNESVTVAAGTFTDCVRIRKTTSGDPVCYKLIWLSLSKGVIKTEGTTTEDYPTIIYEELSTYHL